VTKRSALAKEKDALDFAVYDALHSLGVPSPASAVAAKLKRPHQEVGVRRVLTKLFKMKAVSRSKVRGTWHYFI
jgi:hypothetical protein